MTRNSQSNSSTNIDAANPALLITGCVIIGLMMLIFGPAMPIFMALLALAPAMLASEKGGSRSIGFAMDSCFGLLPSFMRRSSQQIQKMLQQ